MKKGKEPTANKFLHKETSIRKQLRWRMEVESQWELRPENNLSAFAIPNKNLRKHGWSDQSVAQSAIIYLQIKYLLYYSTCKSSAR